MIRIENKRGYAYRSRRRHTKHLNPLFPTR
jgi:hypothetical protein